MATPRAELIDMLRAYKALERILSSQVEPRELYKPGFVRGVKAALRDVKRGRTTKVRAFEDFLR